MAVYLDVDTCLSVIVASEARPHLVANRRCLLYSALLLGRLTASTRDFEGFVP